MHPRSLCTSIGRKLALGLACLVDLTVPFGVVAQNSAAMLPSGTFYDVSTLKRHSSESLNVELSGTRDSLDGRNVSLRMLLENAYGIKEDLIFGIPADIDARRYDVYAKISEPNEVALDRQSPEEARTRIQPMLIERFHVKLHDEIRELPVLELVPSRNGVKIRPDAPEAKGSERVSQSNGSAMETKSITIAHFAEILMPYLGRPVVDRTGLKGTYSFRLSWTNDRDDSQGGATIFTALQEQLGLRLQAGKGPVKVLVVDHVEEPTPN